VICPLSGIGNRQWTSVFEPRCQLSMATLIISPSTRCAAVRSSSAPLRLSARHPPALRALDHLPRPPQLLNDHRPFTSSRSSLAGSAVTRSSCTHFTIWRAVPGPVVPTAGQAKWVIWPTLIRSSRPLCRPGQLWRSRVIMFTVGCARIGDQLTLRPNIGS
jgi:hypothetical protein